MGKNGGRGKEVDKQNEDGGKAKVEGTARKCEGKEKGERAKREKGREVK